MKEPCEICKHEHIDLVVKASSKGELYDEWWLCTSPSVGLPFCPMCGRKLQEDGKKGTGE